MAVFADTNIVGIYQSDLILQSAIVESLSRIIADPDEIDYIFQSLNQDKLTAKAYGQEQIDRFKEWFLSQDVPVSPSFRIDETVMPIISFGLNSSDETQETLGDTHYVTHENTRADFPPLAGPFDPVDYAPSSGIMTLPDSVGALAQPGMSIRDHNGRKHAVVDTLDDNVISLTPGTVADFHGSFLNAGPKLITSIESTFMREIYSIGVHVQGEAFYLIALHSILIYALQKFKEELLEARGFEVSTITNTEFRRNNEFGNEVVFSRWLNISGLVKHVWAKKVFRKIETVNVVPTISMVDVGGLIISAVDDDLNNPPVDDQGLPQQPDDSFVVRPQ
jgi:hypothetical protein